MPLQLILDNAQNQLMETIILAIIFDVRCIALNDNVSNHKPCDYLVSMPLGPLCSESRSRLFFIGNHNNKATNKAPQTKPKENDAPIHCEQRHIIACFPGPTWEGRYSLCGAQISRFGQLHVTHNVVVPFDAYLRYS